LIKYGSRLSSTLARKVTAIAIDCKGNFDYSLKTIPLFFKYSETPPRKPLTVPSTNDLL
jgi:hypothetical protein